MTCKMERIISNITMSLCIFGILRKYLKKIVDALLVFENLDNIVYL